jgi:glycine cleavage system H protein
VKEGLRYAKSHEFAAINGDVATVGISDFAQVSSRALAACRNAVRGFRHTHTRAPLQSELGDVVYVELPEVGSEVVKGETFGVVESVKVRQRLARGRACAPWARWW